MRDKLEIWWWKKRRKRGHDNDDKKFNALWSCEREKKRKTKEWNLNFLYFFNEEIGFLTSFSMKILGF